MQIKSKYSALIILIIVITLSIAITSWTSGIVYSMLLSGTIIIALFISKSVWLPEGYGRTKIRLLSLSIIAATAISPFYWKLSVIETLFDFLKTKFPELKSFTVPSTEPTPEILLFTIIGIFIVNYFSRDTTGMGYHKVKLEKEFPEKKIHGKTL